MSRPRLRIAAVLVSVGLLATACTGNPAPSPSGEATVVPSATPTPTPTLSASPTAAPEPTPSQTADTAAPSGPDVSLAGVPKQRVPLPCRDVLTTAEIGEAVAAAPSTVKVTPWNASNGHIAVWQGGMLNCSWESSTPDGSTLQLTVEILPDAAKDFASIDWAERGPYPAGGSGKLGKNSSHYCYPEETGSACAGQFLVKGYWVDYRFTSASPAAKTQSHKPSLVIGTTLRDRLADAGAPGAAHVIPATAARAWKDCSVLDNGKKFRALVKSPGFLVAEGGSFLKGGGLFFEGMDRGGFRHCVWRHADVYSTPKGQVRQLGVDVIPGAAWAWPQIVKEMQANEQAAPISVAGADDAWVICMDADFCKGEAIVDGTWLGLDVAYEDGSGGNAKKTFATAMAYVISRM